tara:strand:- start:1526 stop:2140 length:615 start_codon:yes stop_codon:yes gene_type:complete
VKPLIKICGIKNLDILNQLIELKEIDFLGFIFFEESPRHVSNEFLQALKNINFLNKRPVCVYVDASEQFIEETSSNFTNPILQFHGNETNDFCKAFDNEFWKVIRVKDSESMNMMSDYPDASAILLENYKKGLYGGTGSNFDWSLVQNLKVNDKKVIISGGINIKNVDNAIRINPWCVDINSGVEITPSIKNVDLIKEIIKKFK